MPDRFRLAPWSRAYTVFRLADGLTHALFPLAVLVFYDLPLWAVAAVAAAMNLGGVPASFWWAKVMEHGRGRRRAAVAGFALSAASLAALATQPPFWAFVALAVVFTVFGAATAPAASTLVLEDVPRSQWARATGALSRVTGYAYLAGFSATVLMGLAGRLHFGALFGVGAGLCLVAALAAWWTIEPFGGTPPPGPRFDAGVTLAGQRRFERAVFFPGRLRHRPTLRGLAAGLRTDPAPLMLAAALLFFGTVMFLSSYPGVLRDGMGLPLGLVLLAQAPAAFLTPMTYHGAGAYGNRFGMARGARLGVLMRVVVVPGLCLSVVLLGSDGLVPLLLLHALMGVSFAFLQVNMPCLAAALHPRGRGEGVGGYHAFVAMGTMAGAVAATVMLLWVDVVWTYVVATAASLAGAWLAMRTLRRHDGAEEALPVPVGLAGAPSIPIETAALQPQHGSPEGAGEVIRGFPDGPHTEGPPPQLPNAALPPRRACAPPSSS